MKTLKAVPYQQGTPFVDDSEIKKGDWYYYPYKNQIYQATGLSNDKVYTNPSCKKIIAQYNLNLEGIPYVELEEDVNGVAHNLAIEVASLYKDVNYDVMIAAAQHFEEGYIKGHRIAQPKLQQALTLMQEFVDRVDKGEVRSTKTYNKFKDFIQSLQPKIESIEVETKGIISNYVAKEIPTTYQKDGKTYLKVKKINYEFIKEPIS